MSLNKDIEGLSAKLKKRYIAYQIVRMLNSPWTVSSGLAVIVRHGLERMTVTELTNLHVMIDYSHGIKTEKDVDDDAATILEALDRR